MNRETTTFESKTEKDIFQSFWYTEVISDFDKLYAFCRIYEKKGFFGEKLNEWDFEEFTKELIRDKNLDIENIEATSYDNGIFYIHFIDWISINFSIEDIKKYLLNISLKWNKLKDLEKRSNNIQDAIESIYNDNDWIFFNWEINNEDIIKTNKYWEDLKWKTLKQLKELLELENEKLFEVYGIIWETNKTQKFLKNEIKFYIWLWDKYEWWARYFSMSTEDINNKLWKLINSMSNTELISYIIDVNRILYENNRTSQMVKQVNSKFLRLLYLHTVEKFKKQNASNKDFINLIKALTGRWALEIDWKNDYNNKTAFKYKSLEIKDDNIDYTLVNELLIYLMYKDWWVLQELSKNKMLKVEVLDKEIKWRSSKIIVDEVIWKLNWIYKQSVWDELLKEAGFNNLLNIDKQYNELSYDEKISLWALARILKIFNESSDQDLLNPNFIKNKSLEAVKESLDELNENLSNNFNESLFDWNWINSDELNLKWELAEIYELYQDINWNKWLFDFKDKNTWTSWNWTIVMWIWLIAWAYFIWPLLVWQWALLTWMALFKAWALAWAKLWLVTWVASNVFSHQWYDTYDEAVLDISSQILVDTVTSAWFTALWLPIIKKMWNINPDLIFSKEAWTTASWLVDKWFILWEVGITWMVISPKVWSMVENKFSENHIDTDEK